MALFIKGINLPNSMPKTFTIYPDGTIKDIQNKILSIKVIEMSDDYEQEDKMKNGK